MLGITLYQKTQSVRELYFRLKSMIETLFAELKHSEITFEAVSPEREYEHPTNLNEILCDGEVIGKLGIVHPVVQKKLDKRASVVFAELDVEKFSKIENKSISYEAPSKFPAIEIDLSFITSKFAPIKRAIENAKCALIKDVDVIDIYEAGDQSSIAVRIVFCDSTRTLTREEVTAVTDAIVVDLENEGICLKG